MNVSFNGFDEGVITFETDGDIEINSPVMITSNGKVSEALGTFCGICKCTKNGYAAVQLNGYVVVPYVNAPMVGYSKLTAINGKVTTDNIYGREYLVINVDTSAKTVGFIL